MKGYEDVAAGLMLLIVILAGGYVYLNDQANKQKEVLQIPQKHVELRADKKQTFESLVKITE